MQSKDDATDLLGQQDERVSGRRLQLAVIGQRTFDSVELPDRGELVIGRGEQADIQLDDTGASRRHAVLRIGDELELEDLGSANGTKIGDAPVEPHERVKLEVNDVISIGTTVLIVQLSAGAARPRRLWQHGYFELRLEDECARARRSGSTFALARVQLDASANEQSVLQILASSLRMSDVLARYGPHDYEALLADAEPEEADQVLERVVTRLAAASIGARYGVALFPRDGRTPEALVAAVASALTASTTEPPPVVIEDAMMQRLHELIGRVATSDINVLVLGETGVGKEVISEAIHRRSPRTDKPYLRLNCAALSETLLESELFGHEKGAFTGAAQTKPGLLETAHGGTVLLDEVGELPISVQVKLLRVIDAREVMRVGGLKPKPIDVRFIAATNRDLDAEIERGTFRQDLYFRLAGFSLVVPPLRQRTTEIVGLATAFIAAACDRAGRRPPSLSAAALELLRNYSWPGNVRELRNVIERALVLCAGDSIGVEHLPVEKMGETVAVHIPRAAHVSEHRGHARASRPTLPNIAIDRPSDAVHGALSGIATDDELTAEERAERDRIVDALTRAGGNQSRACQLLSMSRGTFIQRLARYRIPRPRKGQT